MTDPDADLLRVAPDAPLAEVKKAFRKAALAHHPDQNPHPEAARHFRRLTEAYRSLEARALLREPPGPRREIPLSDQVGFVLGDVAALVRRWPADRWTRTVDGLPASVWVASVLDVMARCWPGPPTTPVRPTVEGITGSLEDWSRRRTEFPLPHPLPRTAARALAAAVRAAERRLQALERSPRARV